MSEQIPTLTPGENYWDRIGINRGPHAPQGDDFTTLLPAPVPASDPTNIPEPITEHAFLYGETPDVVFTEGSPVAPPKQARRYASGGVLPAGDPSKAPEWMRDRTGCVIPADHPALDAFKPLLDRLGPGAGAMVERELDRAHAFEVIALAAVAWVDNVELDDEESLAAAVIDAVRENRAAI